MQKNVAGQKVVFFAYDTSTGLLKTGDAANLTAYVNKDGAAGPAVVLADTSATEIDATNMKGAYVFDVAQAESNADLLVFACKSVTANIQLDPVMFTTTPPGWNASVAQTGDAYTRIGAPAGASVSADLVTIAGFVDTEVAAILAAVDTEVGAIKTKTDFLPSVAPGAAGGLLIAGANAATTFVSLTVTASFSINGVNMVAQTGDNFARLGAPAGATIAADLVTIAGFIDTEITNIQSRLPAALVGGKMDSSIGALGAGSITAATFAANAINAAAVDPALVFNADITAGGLSAIVAAIAGATFGISSNIKKGDPLRFPFVVIDATGAPQTGKAGLLSGSLAADGALVETPMSAPAFAEVGATGTYWVTATGVEMDFDSIRVRIACAGLPDVIIALLTQP